MAEPYYSDSLVTLYHGNAQEITDWTAADVLVTDPPYGIRYEDGAGARIEGDLDTTVREAALQLWGTRPALVFGRWDVPRPALTRARLIWDKGTIPGAGTLTLPWGRTDEEIYVLGVWPPVKAGGRFREGGTPARHPSVIRVQTMAPGSAARPNHPTPKPVSLMELLLAPCPPGVVADPFAGSGATLLAARLQGRRAIGVELHEPYCEIIARRLDQGALHFDEIA